ncbi:unnamed protein product [Brassica napus]|uniref:(rape) hypothetical protein n=1 Tax=Brassica napus TaxID=3708 RepID=A0A816IDV3_BRANA|nr:unnamed protein product [Brassica napus]
MIRYLRDQNLIFLTGMYVKPKLDLSNRNLNFSFRFSRFKNDDHTDHHFASAGAGIILSSGSELVEQFVDTFQQMRLSVGEEASNRLTLYSPWLFNQFLAFNMKQELKTLYNVKVRRMVVMGLPPIEYTLSISLTMSFEAYDVFETAMDSLKNHQLYGRYNRTRDSFRASRLRWLAPTPRDIYGGTSFILQTPLTPSSPTMYGMVGT